MTDVFNLNLSNLIQKIYSCFIDFENQLKGVCVL